MCNITLTIFPKIHLTELEVKPEMGSWKYRFFACCQSLGYEFQRILLDTNSNTLSSVVYSLPPKSLSVHISALCLLFTCLFLVVFSIFGPFSSSLTAECFYWIQWDLFKPLSVKALNSLFAFSLSLCFMSWPSYFTSFWVCVFWGAKWNLKVLWIFERPTWRYWSQCQSVTSICRKQQYGRVFLYFRDWIGSIILSYALSKKHCEKCAYTWYKTVCRTGVIFLLGWEASKTAWSAEGRK